MKSATPELIALLETSGARDFYTRRCVEITTLQGYVLRYTEADVSLRLPETGSVVYRHDGALVEFGPAKQSIGLEVDETTITLTPRDQESADPAIAPLLPTGVTLRRAATNGLLDRARVTIWRAFAAHPGPGLTDLVPLDGDAPAGQRLMLYPVVGGLRTFVGFVAAIEIVAQSIELTVKSALDLLNQPFPRHVYRAGCAWDLYSAGCGIDQTLFRREAFMQNGSTRFVIRSNFTEPRPDGYYSEGVLEVLDGPNAFIKRGIKEHRGGVFVLTQPLPFEPRVGGTDAGFDRIRVIPGCNKKMETCDVKFGNLPRFRGFPGIPGPDAAQGGDVRDVTDDQYPGRTP